MWPNDIGLPAECGRIAGRNWQESTIYTDDMPSYHSLSRIGYDHKVIKHMAKVYIDGDVHTGTIDGFWSLLKRGIDGVYHSVSPKYLQQYVNEYHYT